MKNRVFEILQRIGHSFMLPIAVLPVAGLLLGVGSSLTNASMIEMYHLQFLLGDGTILNGIFTICRIAGNAIFNNLALIFAVGVAIGMAHSEKEVAALSALIAYFVMHASVNAMLVVRGILTVDGEIASNVLKGTITTEVGIQTLQMGVFGGILAGLGVALLHNRFHRIELPSVISFFGGSRFVPIISAITFIMVGAVMSFVWPVVQEGIYMIGGLVTGTGYIGTLIFGIVKRALIPFGLHHVFYLPFWQTGVGGSMEVAGQLVEGGQNIFFAQLADPHTTQFSADACRYFSGEFIFMIFGLPGAALAMYHCAKPERKKKVGGLLLSAALTSMLTGITEPMEFSFLFVAPVLFVVQVILAGFAYMIAHMLHIAVGLTFSGGLIDFFLFGILQGNAKTNWVAILPVGIIYFFLYYGIFRYLILKLNLKTPGREDDGEITKIYTKEDMKHRTEHILKEAGQIKDIYLTSMIAQAVGGRENIVDIDCCATRLRFVLKNADLVNEDLLRESGSRGILIQGNSIQIIYGPHVTNMKSDLEQYLRSGMEEHAEEIGINNAIDFLEQSETIQTPIKGKVIALSEVEDTVFSLGMLGEGFAVEPEIGEIYAPVTGTVSAIFDTKHAIGFLSEEGAEILVHVGINTVMLGADYFNLSIETGQKVTKGELVGTFNLDGIKEKGYLAVTPVVVVNGDLYSKIKINLNDKNVITLIK
jgi:PTS system D-glucosamine-specific IIC component